MPTAESFRNRRSATGLRELRAQGMTPARYPQAGRALAEWRAQLAPWHADRGAAGRGSRAEKPEDSRKARRAAGAQARRASRATPRAARAIEIALAGLAHDIRTPLTGILALADLLLASDLPEREQRWAAAIKDAAEHLARLTTLVVDAAKAGGGGLVLHAEPFSLRDLVDAVAAIARRPRRRQGARASKIAIAEDLPGRVDRRCGAAAQRAGKPDRQRGEVHRARRRRRSPSRRRAAPRGRLRLTFAVDRHRHRHRRAPISSGCSGRSPRPTRTWRGATAAPGLGLAFVKRIAEAMGGDLTVNSSPAAAARSA